MGVCTERSGAQRSEHKTALPGSVYLALAEQLVSRRDDTKRDAVVERERDERRTKSVGRQHLWSSRDANGSVLNESLVTPDTKHADSAIRTV